MRKRDGEHGTVHSEKIAPREVAVTTKSQYGTFLAACLLLGAGLSPIRAQDGVGRSAADAPRPDIVLIVADDLGYGDLGAYGQQQIRTPHLDRMAKEGLRFTQFYSGSTVCAPSRSVLVTGQRTGRTPIQGNMPVKPTGQKPLPDTTVTVAEMLRDSGYRTGMSGKWGLGGSGSESAPHRQGFDLGGTSVASDVGPARTGMESPGPRKDVPEMGSRPLVDGGDVGDRWKRYLHPGCLQRRVPSCGREKESLRIGEIDPYGWRAPPSRLRSTDSLEDRQRESDPSSTPLGPSPSAVCRSGCSYFYSPSNGKTPLFSPSRFPSPAAHISVGPPSLGRSRRAFAVEGRVGAGCHARHIDLLGITSGVHFLRLRAGPQTATQRLMVVG